MPECNRLVFRAGEELIEAAKRNDFCKVAVPGSGFFPLAALAGPRKWGLWLGRELLGRGAVICHDLALCGRGSPCDCPNLPCPAPPTIIVPP